MGDELHIRKERFQLLLQQILIPEDVANRFLQDGKIMKLTIDREQRSWRFQFQLINPLPVNVYQLFSEHIKQAFAHIATVHFHIQYERTTLEQSLVADYWPMFVSQLQLSDGLTSLLTNQVPQMEGNKLIVYARHEAEATALSRKLVELLNDVLASFGFPPCQIEVRIKESKQEFAEFVEQRSQEDQSKVVEAILEKKKQEKKLEEKIGNGSLVIGIPIKDEPVSIDTIQDEERMITIEGYVFASETKELRSGRTLLTFKITDYTDSILIKMFSRDKDDIPLLEAVKKGMWVKVRGGVQNDTFVRDLVMIGKDVNEIKGPERLDLAEEGEKRVELHLHTSMSQMDGMTSASKYVEQASKWGHPAIAITDHGVVQSFPEAYSAGKKHGIQVIYGLEAYLVDDGVPIAYNEAHRELMTDTYVVFDVETTGLSAVYNTIIELAAVKMKDGEIIERFEFFANPHEPLSNTIIELTGITDDMLVDAPDVDVVLKKFKEFVGDAVLVAHNASFDMGFLNVGYKKYGLGEADNPVIDTLELARFLYPQLKNHRLNTLCKKFDIELVSHHRAIYDAEATGHLFWRLIRETVEKGITYHDELNNNTGEGEFQRQRPSHCILLAQTQTGLKNLYKLVSLSHLHYFYRTPRIPRSQIQKHRDGLMIGSACDDGEVFNGMMQKSPEEVEEIAKFYDYLEVQPPSNYYHLIERELVRDKGELEEIISNVVKLGEKLGKPVVATGNVHYLDPNDYIYRQILISSQGGANPLNRQKLPEVHFRTTDEMLEIFAFLGEEKAKEIVVTNTQFIANEIEDVQPIPDDLYTPKIEGAEEEIRQMSYEKAKSI
ncbi:MAG TPA: PolC-type DNA polymerase III, partial [Bacilli bacterium]|nr:PolC-type DNA polymerase III [Bacilli bacterium]